MRLDPPTISDVGKAGVTLVETDPATDYGERVMPPMNPAHWQNWFCPETLAVNPLIVGVISTIEKVPKVPAVQV